MEPTARRQIEEQLAVVDSLAAANGAQPRELGAAVGGLCRLYHAYGLEDSAAICYREAAGLDPDEARWPYYLGFLHQVRGEAALAAAALERARKLAPDDPATLLRLARARFETGELEAAETLFRRNLEVHPPNAAAAHAGLARIAASRNQHATTVERYEAALALQPGATRLHYPLALAYRELGDTTRAEEHLGLRGDAPVTFPDPLAVALDREAAGAALHVNRAGIALAEGRHEEAVAEYRLAVAADPDHATARSELGMLLAAGGDLAGARVELEAARRLEPEISSHHEALARVLAAEGRELEAIPLFRRAVELDPQRATAHLQLGAALARSGSLREAQESFNRALELDPASSAARLGRAEVMLELGLPRGAAEDLEAVLRSDPDNARANLRLGEARHGLGESAAALARFEAALAGNLEQRERIAALVGAANVLVASGNPAAAVERYRQALVLAPDLEGAAFNLAGALTILGREDEAIGQYGGILERHPENTLARIFRAQLLLHRGRAEEALREFDDALARDPKLSPAQVGAAAALQALGRWREAQRRLEISYKSLPADLLVANALARLLASSPEPSVRDGDRAVQLALALMAADKSPAHAETLAMALAASGRHNEAAEWQRELLSQARAGGAPAAILAQLQSNLELYEAGSPCCAAPGSG